MGTRRFARARRILVGLGLLADRGTWLEGGRLLGCAYPRREAALAGLAGQGVSLLINLHERAHEPARLVRHGLTEVHLPVADFTPPSPAQVDRGVAAIRQALAEGRGVAVHCGGGVGRTGTLLACYLVSGGLGAQAAIAHVRAGRPGAVETRAQVAAVETYARRLQGGERVGLRPGRAPQCDHPQSGDDDPGAAELGVGPGGRPGQHDRLRLRQGRQPHRRHPGRQHHHGDL